MNDGSQAQLRIADARLSTKMGPPRTWRERAVALLFVLPTLCGIAVFVYLPLARAVELSFYHWDGLSPPTWVGWANFRFLFHYSDFRQIVVNNLVLVLGIVVWIVLPLVAAVILMGLKGAQVVRTVLFIPVLMPPVIAGGVFRIVLNDDGPVNTGLRRVGLDPLALHWLTGSRVVLLSVILVIAWAVLGTGVIFYTTGLAAISQSNLEAAAIDGANWFQLVWYVLRPLLRPVTRFWALVLTISTVTAFFPWIFGLTQGGPGISSTTIDYKIYTAAIQNAEFGLACAISVIAVLFVLTLIAIQLVASRLRAARG